MTARAAAIAAILMLPATTALADTTFTITITNNSTTPWTEGVLAVLPEAGVPNALLEVGAVPTAGDQLDSQAFVHQICDIGGEDDGDAALLIARWDSLVEGGNAHVVPALGAGASTTMTFTAQPGEVLSFIARVTGSGDDALVMHVVGDPSDTTIDLFDGTGLPVPAVVFDIGGYDVESASPGNGNGPGCGGTCPFDPAACFISYGNGTVGPPAGGSQATPHDFDQPAWTVVESGFTPDGIAMGDLIPGGQGNELVVMMEGSNWYGSPLTPGTGKAVVLRSSGVKINEFLPDSGRDIMGFPLVTTIAGTAGFFVAEFLGAEDMGAVYALTGTASTPADATWIMAPMDWPGVWNMGVSEGDLVPAIFSAPVSELVVPSWSGLINLTRAATGIVACSFDTFAEFGEVIYGHVAIGNVASASGNEIVVVGGSEGRVMVLDPVGFDSGEFITCSGINLAHASNPQPSAFAEGSGPAIGNIDDDPALEVVVAFMASGGGYIQAFDFQNDTSGGCEYQWDLGTTRGFFWTSPVIGDVDGDGDNEIVVQDNLSQVSILTTEGIAQSPGTCAGGNVLVQNYEVGIGGGSWWTPALGDLHASPGVEIVAASYDTLEVLYFENGQLNVAHRAVEPSATFYPSAAIEAGSVTGASGRVYTSGWINGSIYRFDTPNGAPVPANWVTVMGNNVRTGLAP